MRAGRMGPLETEVPVDGFCCQEIIKLDPFLSYVGRQISGKLHVLNFDRCRWRIIFNSLRSRPCRPNKTN